MQRLQETRNHALLTRRIHIPPAVFHKLGRTQKRDRHLQIAERLLDNRVPGQQVGLTRLRSDGAKINHSRRPRRPRAARSAAPIARASGNPGCGSKFGGTSTKHLPPLGTLP
jgi:hypothetical protein